MISKKRAFLNHVTFDVDVLNEFYRVAEQRKMSRPDAVREAVKMWIIRHNLNDLKEDKKKELGDELLEKIAETAGKLNQLLTGKGF